VHGGRSPHYLELFTEPDEILVDTLQSEHGSWFLRKRNRNMVVGVAGAVPPRADFCWLTLGQVLRLLREDDAVNMDARTVLSCIPFAAPGASTRDIQHWLVDLRTRRELVQRTIPCDAVGRWHRSADEIFHEERRHFSVLGFRVEAASREIAGWTQPLIHPAGLGVVALVVRDLDREPRLLVHGRVEAGLIDVAELAPTVQCIPASHPDALPPYTEQVLSAAPEQIRYDTVQSEEGGRFHRARNRYMILEPGADWDPRLPDDYVWVTLGEATGLIERGYHLNVQARSLLAALQSILLCGKPDRPVNGNRRDLGAG
jgi:oxidase EvaA